MFCDKFRILDSSSKEYQHYVDKYDYVYDELQPNDVFQGLNVKSNPI